MSGEEKVTGASLMLEVLDLLERRLPQLSRADPAYSRMAALVPQLAATLGRPPVRPVPQLEEA